MPYFPSASNITGFRGLLDYVNNVTTHTAAGGAQTAMFGPLLLIAIFMISFLSLKYYQTEEAFIAAIFITMLSSFFLAPMGLINAMIPLILVCVGLGSLFMLYKK